MQKTRTVKTTIQIPSVLRDCCHGATELCIAANSVNAALAGLQRSYPELYTSICDETGAVRRHVNLFVNSSLVRDRDEFEAKLLPGDTIAIFPAVSGG